MSDLDREAGGGAMPSAAPLIAPARARRQRDGLLIAAVGGLLLIGILAVFTAADSRALQGHLMWSAVGITAAGVVATLGDYRLIQRWSPVMFLGLIGLLVLVLLIGQRVHGSTRWLFSGSVQPGELAKLVVVIYIADWLSGRPQEIRQFAMGLVPFILLVSLVCGLIILQPNFSTAILVLGIASAMLVAAGARIDQMLLSGSIAVVVLTGALIMADYRVNRVMGFMNANALADNANWQPNLVERAVLRGGWFGVGLGNGQYKHFMPLDTGATDSVFAVIGEETGVLGCLLVVALFAVIAWRGIRIARGAPDPFAKLAALGVTWWIVSQALVHMMVVTRLIPFTGVPLPFISSGGSSLTTTLVGVGLLLAISQRVDPTKVTPYGLVDLRWWNRRSRVSRAYRARRAGLAG